MDLSPEKQTKLNRLLAEEVRSWPTNPPTDEQRTVADLIMGRGWTAAMIEHARDGAASVTIGRRPVATSTRSVDAGESP